MVEVYTKSPLTFEQQLQQLKDRGLIIENIEAEGITQREAAERFNFARVNFSSTSLIAYSFKCNYKSVKEAL